MKVIALFLVAFTLKAQADSTFTYLLDGSLATITGFTATASGTGSITIPSTVDGYTVTAIDRAAFRNRTGLTAISFASGNSITQIGAQAFAGCSSLTTASLPAGLTRLSMGIFDGCTALVSVTLPSALTEIEAAAFAGCRQLNSLTLPSSVNKVGESAFLNASALSAISLPSGLTAVADQLFEGCSSLTTASLPASVNRIGALAFRKTALTTFTAPSATTQVASRAFEQSPNLQTVTFGSQVTDISNTAFTHCDALAAFYVASANPTYSTLSGVLYNKTQTTLLLAPPALSGAFTVPPGVITIGASAFAHVTGLGEIHLPVGLQSIANDAFYYSTGLELIELPDSLLTLGSWAFAGTGLTTVTLPSSLSHLGDDVFHGAGALGWALFEGNAPVTGTEFFDDSDPAFTVFFLNSSNGFSEPEWMGYPSRMLTSDPAVLSWLGEIGLSPGTDVESDPDGDGVALLTAYALGLDPSQNLSSSMPNPVITPSGLSLTFQGDRPGITYLAEGSDDLTHWDSSGITLSEPDGAGMRTATLSTGSSARFIRLRFLP